MGSTPGSSTLASISRKKMYSKFRPVTGQLSSLVMLMPRAASLARMSYRAPGWLSQARIRLIRLAPG